jgi:hypothetical protein
MTPEDRERKRCALARDLYGPGSPCTDDPVIDAMVCAKETIRELRAKLADADHGPRVVLTGDRVTIEGGVRSPNGTRDVPHSRDSWEDIRAMVDRSHLLRFVGDVRHTGRCPVIGWSRTPLGISDNGERTVHIEIELIDPEGVQP